MQGFALLFIYRKPGFKPPSLDKYEKILYNYIRTNVCSEKSIERKLYDGHIRCHFLAAFEGDGFNPVMGTSTNHKHWISVEDWKRCIECAKNHGKIWLIAQQPFPEPPIHPHCRCVIELMKTITAGTATMNGVNGADWTLKYNGKLPDYYVTKEEAEVNGWKPSKWLSNFMPDKMITRGRYYNDDGHLPQAPERIWYEADINYKTGKRNSQRILWSNDGLIFVTYDHYETFYEIV